MSKKIKDVVTASGTAAAAPNATSMSDGKTYIKDPNIRGRILQVQEREGSGFKCFPVTKKEGSVVTVDSSTAVYVSENYEATAVRI